MHRFLFSLFGLLCLGNAHAAESITVLAYHDVADQVSREVNLGNTTVSTENLRAQFEWLKTHHYTVIGVDALLDARKGKRKLPDHAVLLSFDDGFASFYQKVYPLLKAYHYQALTAVVSSWLEVEAGGDVPFSERETWKRERFMRWEELREMLKSGLVEIASHSHDAHRGLVGNPKRELQPVYVTRLYNPADAHYEDDAAYEQRINQDIQRSSDILFKHLGVRPRVIAWPYGEYNQPTIASAQRPA